MSDIDEYLDTALGGCKQRAAEFDDRAGWRPMSECDQDDVSDFFQRAETNLSTARVRWQRYGTADITALRRDLRDAVNMGLLALSILEREP
jgi:hypothetical protein